MEKYNVVFLISDENKWDHLILQIGHLQQNKELIGRIAIVVVNTAILSCLKSSKLKEFQNKISALQTQEVEFYLCNNTCKRYGIASELILPEFSIVNEGGLIKAIVLEATGYHLFSLG